MNMQRACLLFIVVQGVLMSTAHGAAGATHAMDRQTTYRVVCDDGRYWIARGAERLMLFGVNCVDAGAGGTTGWQRLQSWGFNTVGGWSDGRLCTQGMPHTRVAWLGGWGAAALVDVFSEEYAQRFHETVVRDIVPHAGEPGLIGWYANNEMAWYGDFGWPTEASHALLYKYAALPADAPGKRALVAFLRARAGNTVARFNATWSPSITSFAALGSCTTLAARSHAAHVQISAWAGVVAEKYLAMARAAIMTNSPGALFLGVRFAGLAPRSVLEVCGRHVDVVSLNLYRKDGVIDVPNLDNIYALTKKPLLITEFSWRAMENASGNPNTRGADVTVPTQADRAERCSTYCRTLAALPYCVGWDWFQYMDQPPGGRFDGENSNYGLVSIHDKPYPEITRALKQVNTAAPRLHQTSRHPLPAMFDPAAWYELRAVTVRPVSRDVQVRPVPVKIAANMPLAIWKDDHAGATLRAHVMSNMLEISAAPQGWGCGVDLPMPGQRKDASVNAAGVVRVLVRARIPQGNTIAITLNESGAAPPGEQTYVGARGADGEAFTSPPLVGTGAWATYDMPLADFALATGYGNQRGKCEIDTQALRAIGISLPGTQPACNLTIAAVTLAPPAKAYQPK
jgi:hypothetical protein